MFCFCSGFIMGIHSKYCNTQYDHILSSKHGLGVEGLGFWETPDRKNTHRHTRTDIPTDPKS